MEYTKKSVGKLIKIGLILHFMRYNVQSHAFYAMARLVNVLGERESDLTEEE